MSWMDYISAEVDRISAKEFQDAGGITLGQMIELLKQAQAFGADLDAPISGLISPHSYRGYYERLAFEEGETTLREMLALAESCVSEVFTGYKGGTFTMDGGSMVHVAPYGCAPDDDELTIPRLLAFIRAAPSEAAQ